MNRKTVSVLLCLAMLLSVFAIMPANAVTTAEESVGVSKVESPSDFSWDNANVYFLMTDRFYNGNKSNDHSYGRALDQNGNALSGWNTAPGTFHGGDFAGLTQKINEGYFDKLGTNALWITAPYEQIHGYVTSGENTSPQHFAHYSYHGYYVLDYTETDANFGTKQEFKTMVDAAHKHGIRVVMDIVMNHAGYNNLLDMESYGYGTLKSGYQQYKYRLTNANDFHSCIDYASSASDWGKWWGPSWIRSGLPGYEEGGGEVTGCLAGLPDFRTESTATVGIPQFLQTKWSKEGTLNSKKTRYSSCRTVNDYLTTWLAEWVENYGVDGFRCDTAKHVEMESWVKLKNKCVAALKKWRQNNPSADGADWDEDFWMTGEHWGHGLGKDSYFTSGAFDSMINFSITGNVSQNPGGMPGVDSINSMYQNYASNINTDPNYNMLTYISSHDTGLVRQNQFWQGTALQLLPGGIQIFYGDETSRPLVSGVAVEGSGHAVRSDMNFGQNNDLLTHWQKVGKFRSNHIAVGAGTHQQISGYNSSTGYTFSRSYVDDNVSDGVVCCIGAPKNQNIAVNVSSMWGNGKTVTNEYDGTTTTVQNGKATFNSGSQGVILISGPQSTISMSLKGDYGFYDQENVTLKLRGADYAMVSVNGGTAFRVVDGQTFSIGEDIEKGTVFTVKVTATNAVETSDKEFSFKKKDPDAVTRIYFDNSSYKWGTPIKAYVYVESGTEVKENAAWPGESMSLDSKTGLYVYEVPEDLTNGKVIFSGGNGRYPGEMEAGLSIEETDKILLGGNQWVPYTPGEIPTVTPPDPSQNTTVYFDNSSSNFSTPTIYYWKSGESQGGVSWPGVPMDKYKGNVYKYSLPKQYNCCIFSNGNEQTKTGDLTIPGNNYIYNNGSWSVYSEAETTPATNPTQGQTTITVKLGDTNRDGNVTISDATAIQYHTATIRMLKDAALAAGDANQDGSVNIKDATAIQYYLAGIRNSGNHCGESKTVKVDGGSTPATQPATTPTQPVTQPSKNYIYVRSSNWQNVKVYFWSDENKNMMQWPGVDTENLGNNVFRAEVPAGATWVIFNNGSGGNGNQTNDTKIEGYNKILDMGVWSDYTG